MTVFVTGSSGYIGSFLVDELRKRGHVTIGLDRLEPEWAEPDSFIHADLLDGGALAGVFEGVDLVAHLAAARVDWGLSDAGFFRDNLHATEALLNAGRAQGVSRWVFYSTVGVMGASRQAIDESAPYAPSIAYGASKADAERLFRRYAEEDPDAHITMIRPSAVYGPRNPPNTNIHRLIEAVHRDRFVMVGDGSALKTTSHLGNLLPATFFLMDRMRAGVGTYIYVDQPVLTTEELVRNIYSLLDKPRRRWHVPLVVARPIALLSDIAASVSKIDFPITSSRIKKFCTSTNFDPAALLRLGFVPPVSNEQALRDTVAWYLTH